MPTLPVGKRGKAEISVDTPLSEILTLGATQGMEIAPQTAEASGQGLPTVQPCDIDQSRRLPCPFVHSQIGTGGRFVQAPRVKSGNSTVAIPPSLLIWDSGPTALQVAPS